jgi:hypothetical protein
MQETGSLPGPRIGKGGALDWTDGNAENGCETAQSRGAKLSGMWCPQPCPARSQAETETKNGRTTSHCVRSDGVCGFSRLSLTLGCPAQCVQGPVLVCRCAVAAVLSCACGNSAVGRFDCEQIVVLRNGGAGHGCSLTGLDGDGIRERRKIGAVPWGVVDSCAGPLLRRGARSRCRRAETL